jgi:hypothetical protein
MTATTVRAGGVVRRSPRGAWILMAAQFAYVIWFGVCVWVTLAMAAHFAGHVYVPHQGDRYTAEADIFTGWARGFETPLTITIMLQPIIALASIGVTVWQLAQQDTRARRLAFWLLLTSAVLVFATFVLANAPAGRAISGWILD